ncbi:MAG: hypothetical protein NW237_03585 [Cyanobacteriota bacterium]|nr:hypothetical protein [Cyanobacteriota bacterium]
MCFNFARLWGATRTVLTPDAYIAHFKDINTALAFSTHYPGARVAKSKWGNIYVAVSR